MTQEPSLQERLVRIEELYSHHQHTIEQLNDVLVRLCAEVESLETRVARQEARLQVLSEKQESVDDQPDEKPPHY